MADVLTVTSWPCGINNHPVNVNVGVWPCLRDVRRRQLPVLSAWIQCCWPFLPSQTFSLSHFHSMQPHPHVGMYTHGSKHTHLGFCWAFSLSLSFSVQYIMRPDVPWTPHSLLSDTAHRQTRIYMNTLPQCEVTWVTQGRLSWHRRVVTGVLVSEPVLTSVSVLTSPCALNSTFAMHTYTHTHAPTQPTSWQLIRNDWTCQDQFGHSHEEIRHGHAHCHMHMHTICLLWTISRAISPSVPPGLGSISMWLRTKGETLLANDVELGEGSSMTLVKTRLTCFFLSFYSNAGWRFVFTPNWLNSFLLAVSCPLSDYV